ncbi:MAG: hypothetical protein MUC94_08300, partial [bacterium]|nr:hypothetical protein [bacterium]
MFRRSMYLISMFFISQAICLAQTDTWIYKAKLPTARTFASGCVFDKKFYVIGGSPASAATAAVEAYNPATDSWEKKANLPAARCYPIVCAFQGKIYVFGGSLGMWSSALKTVYVYDPQSDSWDQKK